VCGKCCDGRGPLCEWVSVAEVKCDAHLPCRWKGHDFDPSDWVPLACVTLVATKDPCNPIGIGSVKDACSPRRVVKNNDLLYDLIRGCDLTHIDHISWAVWHRGEKPMPFDTFKDFLGPGPVVEGDLEYALTKFSIRFSGPVLTETVTPDCFAFRITVRHTDTGWFDQRAVPVIKVVCDPPAANDPANTTRKVTLGIHPEFFVEATDSANAFVVTYPYVKESVSAEIETYGDYILDCNKQPIDGNARGFSLRKPEPAPGQPVDDTPPKHLGNGTPGGSFLSIFHIEKIAKPVKGKRGA
jgi:hypothetical protein